MCLANISKSKSWTSLTVTRKCVILKSPKASRGPSMTRNMCNILTLLRWIFAILPLSSPEATTSWSSVMFPTKKMSTLEPSFAVLEHVIGNASLFLYTLGGVFISESCHINSWKNSWNFVYIQARQCITCFILTKFSTEVSKFRIWLSKIDTL